MAWAFQDGGEPRHLGQHGLHPRPLLAGPAFGQDTLGRLNHHGDDPGRPAQFVQHRRIVEIHPRRLGLAVAMQRQLLVLVLQRAAGQAGLHDIVVEIGDLGPALTHLGAQKLGMATAGKHRIGVVIQHDAVFVPQHDDRHRRAQQQVQRRAQRARPGVDGTDRGLRPIVIGNQPPGLAALSQAVDKGRIGAVGGVCGRSGRHGARVHAEAPVRTYRPNPRFLSLHCRAGL